MSRNEPTGKSVVAALALVVRKYLILLTLASTLLAIPIGYYLSGVVAANRPLISNLVVVLAVLTIYPSMIQLKTEGLLKSMRKVKEILLSLIYVFLASPLLAILVAPTLGDPYVGVGYVAANVVPASSASLGYVLIAGGSVELATVLAVLTLVVGIPVIPLIIGAYSSSVAIPVPMEPIITSLVEILLLPLLAGQLTRYALARRRGVSYVEKTIRPHLSLATMLAMLALVFVLVLNQAMTIVAKPALAVLVIAYQSVVIAALLLLSLVVSKLLRVSYEDHQALALISITKNQSVAAAMAVTAFGPRSALAPALIPIIQPVLAIAYLQAESWVRKFLSGGTLQPA
ncbi:MAG: bile acid:sodium symporter [Thermofilum sp.]|jgi:ACR3 family arsenite efflux pump ArsB|nr:bile acid:sodium symporter [Thermofilum sp.]